MLKVNKKHYDTFMRQVNGDARGRHTPPEKIELVRQLVNEGQSVNEICRAVGVYAHTVRMVRDGLR